MSVWKDTYLVYGFKVTNQKLFELINDDWYDNLMEEEPYSKFFNNRNSAQGIIIDGMCGNYIYIGIKLARIEEDSDDACINLKGTDVINLQAKLEKYMEEWPDYLVNALNDIEPGLWLFTHYY